MKISVDIFIVISENSEKIFFDKTIVRCYNDTTDPHSHNRYNYNHLQLAGGRPPSQYMVLHPC